MAQAVPWNIIRISHFILMIVFMQTVVNRPEATVNESEEETQRTEAETKRGCTQGNR